MGNLRLEEKEKESEITTTTTTTTKQLSSYQKQQKLLSSYQNSKRVAVGTRIRQDQIKAVKELTLEIHGSLHKNYSIVFEQIVDEGISKFKRKQMQAAINQQLSQSCRGNKLKNYQSLALHYKQAAQAFSSRGKKMLVLQGHLLDDIKRVTNAKDPRTIQSYFKEISSKGNCLVVHENHMNVSLNQLDLQGFIDKYAYDEGDGNRRMSEFT